MKTKVMTGLISGIFLIFLLWSSFAAGDPLLEITSGGNSFGNEVEPAPGDGSIVSISLEQKSEKWTQWAVTYMSTGLRVNGKLFVPEDKNEQQGESRRAGVVFNHGGISGIPGPTVERCRELAELGFYVFAPSYRGEDGSEGEVEVAAGEVDDALNAVKLLRRMPSVDATRIGMMGTSHGGIITLIAIERDSSIAAAICAYGVTNTYSWYKYLVDNGFDVSDPLSVKVYGNGPEDKPEAFRSRAPALNVQSIKTPLLMIYGANDSIVPPSQADEMAEALDKSQIPYDLHVIPDVGHGLLFFKDPDKRSELEIKRSAEAWTLVVEFLLQHLDIK